MKRFLKTALMTMLFGVVASSALATGPSDNFYFGGTFDGSTGTISPSSYGSVGTSGFGGGAFGGYGVNAGGYYVGVEGSYDATLSGGKYVAPGFEAKFASYGNAGVVGRLGFYPMQGTMAYIEGGGAYDYIKMSDTFPDSNSVWKLGYRVGVGVDFALTQNVFMRVSYDADLFTFNPYILGLRTSTDVINQTAKVGLGYHF